MFLSTDSDRDEPPSMLCKSASRDGSIPSGIVSLLLFIILFLSIIVMYLHHYLHQVFKCIFIEHGNII